MNKVYFARFSLNNFIKETKIQRVNSPLFICFLFGDHINRDYLFGDHTNRDYLFGAWYKIVI